MTEHRRSLASAVFYFANPEVTPTGLVGYWVWGFFYVGGGVPGGHGPDVFGEVVWDEEARRAV